MHILSHRGFWQQPSEKNTLTAFRRSFELGFGTETDIRDSGGKLVIAHDIPTGDEPTLVAVLDLMRETACNRPLALNVKSDGLQAALAQTMGAYPDISYFVFDMSMPETLAYARAALPFYLRSSEYEQHLPPVAGNQGIWLDSFDSCWYDSGQLARMLERGKVCVVSAELHRRPHLEHWNQLQATGLVSHPRLTLCTDHPVAAEEFFNEH
jgi:hypothetical protein